jgi:glycosyltransferase involved in cell wall biosynthesis
MNVLLLIDDLLPGGIARHIADLANALLHTDIKIYVSATPGKFLSKFHKDVLFYPINLLKEDSFEKNYFGIFSSYYRLVKLIKEERIEIIHSHKRYAHFIGKLLSKTYGIPHITSYHIAPEGKKIFTVFGDFSICCADAVKKKAINEFGCKPERVMTIHYGIEPFEIYCNNKKTTTLDKFDISPRKKIISSVGQFIPVKDKESLIIAVKMLKEEKDISDYVFILLGYGPQKDYLVKLVKEYELEQAIIFVDGLFSVEALFNISEFMILSSLLEGFPIVHLEAASLGKMHISTNVGGNSEFIENNNTGILIEPKNPKQLAKSIAYLIDNPHEYIRMGTNAKMKYENEFTFSLMLNKIIKVYQSTHSNNIYVTK